MEISLPDTQLTLLVIVSQTFSYQAPVTCLMTNFPFFPSDLFPMRFLKLCTLCRHLRCKLLQDYISSVVSTVCAILVSCQKIGSTSSWVVLKNTRHHPLRIFLSAIVSQAARQAYSLQFFLVSYCRAPSLFISRRILYGRPTLCNGTGKKLK